MFSPSFGKGLPHPAAALFLAVISKLEVF